MKRKRWFLVATALLLAAGAFCLWRPSGGAVWSSLTGLFGGGDPVASSGLGADSQAGREPSSRLASGSSRRGGAGTIQTGGAGEADLGNPGGGASKARRTVLAKDHASASENHVSSLVTSKRLSPEEIKRKGDQRLGAFKRSLLSEEYARFFELSGLSFEQRERVLDILVREFLSNMDAVRKRERWTDANGKKLDYRSMNRAEAHAALSQVIPPDKLGLYDEYRSSLYTRELVEDVNVVLARHSEQLAPEVVDSVTRILHQHKIPTGLSHLGEPISQERYDFLTRDDPIVLKAVSQVLTPRQFELFKLSFAARFQVKR